MIVDSSNAKYQSSVSDVKNLTGLTYSVDVDCRELRQTLANARLHVVAHWDGFGAQPL